LLGAGVLLVEGFSQGGAFEFLGAVFGFGAECGGEASSLSHGHSGDGDSGAGMGASCRGVAAAGDEEVFDFLGKEAAVGDVVGGGLNFFGLEVVGAA